jgi:hypothetical protein
VLRAAGDVVTAAAEAPAALPALRASVQLLRQAREVCACCCGRVPHPLV